MVHLDYLRRGCISAELLNTAIERLARAITRKYHPEIRDALDVSSAAVLIIAIGAVLLAMLILGRPLLDMFFG